MSLLSDFAATRDISPSRTHRALGGWHERTLMGGPGRCRERTSIVVI